MQPPELTPQEERDLANLIELQIDTAIEEKKIYEVTTTKDDGDE